MTVRFWTDYWFYWLLAVLLSWVVMEVASIVMARAAGQSVLQVWTLSDTIRRWSIAHRWLAPLAVGTAAMLIWHFFGQSNR